MGLDVGALMHAAAREVVANRHTYVIVIVESRYHAGLLAKLLTRAFDVPASSITEVHSGGTEALASRRPIVIVAEPILTSEPCRFWAPPGVSDVIVVSVLNGEVKATHRQCGSDRFGLGGATSEPALAAPPADAAATAATSERAAEPSAPHSAPAYAAFKKRGVAYVLDGVFISVLAMVVVAAFSPSVGGPSGAGLLTAMAVWWTYFAGTEASAWQGTPGKRLVGIIVTDTAGGRIGFGRASARLAAKIVSGSVLGVGFLVAAFTRRKQALHDLVAGTVVVEPGSVGAVAPTATTVRALAIAPEDVRAIIAAFVNLPIDQNEATVQTWDYVRRWNRQLAEALERRKGDFSVGGIVALPSVDEALKLLKEQLDGRFNGCRLIVQHSGVQVQQRSSGRTFNGIIVLATFVASRGEPLVIVGAVQDVTIVPAATTRTAPAPKPTAPEVKSSEPKVRGPELKVMVCANLLEAEMAVKSMHATSSGGSDLKLYLMPSQSRSGGLEWSGQDHAGKWHNLAKLREPAWIFIARDTLPLLKQSGFWSRVTRVEGV